jgi:DNA invertase Pin-like site-specific DNA recombinase
MPKKVLPMIVYGYARCSTLEQSLDGQVASLRAAGAEKVFAEKVSGARTDRAAVQKALAALGAGDVLVVTRLDRLARSTRDLLNVLATVSERGAAFKSLADAWADTTTPHGINNPQQSWGFEWEPPKAVMKDSGTRDWTLWGGKLQL